MAEIPEEPAEDGALVLVGEPEVQVVLVRDDESARVQGMGASLRARWWPVHQPESEDPLTWDEVTETDPDAIVDELPTGLNRQAVIRLYTQDELDDAVVAGGYEDIGDHRIALGAGRCVTHGEEYSVPELERLREREGGGSSG